MKAYRVTPDPIGYGAMLLFAASRNRARYVALNHGTWEYPDYLSINVRRAAVYDGAFDTEMVIDTNDDLPAGYPPFYCDDCDD